MSLRPKHRDILHLITPVSVHNHKQSTNINGKKGDLYNVKFQKLINRHKILQVLANPESSDPPENNDPPKVETSKLISLFAKITDMIDTLNTDPRFSNNDYFDILIHNSFKYRIYITFFKKYSFRILCDFFQK